MRKVFLALALLLSFTGVANAQLFSPPNATNFKGVLPVTKGGSGVGSLGTTITNQTGVLEVANPLRKVTGTTDTIAETDKGGYIEYNNATGVSTTLSSTASYSENFAFTAYNIGLGNVTITPSTGTIYGKTSVVISPKTGCSFHKDGTNWEPSLDNCPALQSFNASATVRINGTTQTSGPTLGSELLSSSGWTSTNWTGDFSTGFTHTTGNTTALSNSYAPSVNSSYQLSLTVTGRTAGNYSVSFGGMTLYGQSATLIYGFRATSTSGVSITPSSDFDGTIVFSLKQITAPNKPLVSYYNDSGVLLSDIHSGASGTNNTFFGSESGQYLLPTRGSNTGFGASALKFLSGGEYNTAVGRAALETLSAGSYNTAIGGKALNSLTAGQSNTLVGYDSFVSMTTGNGNTGIGRSICKNITTGSLNICVGYSGLGTTLTTGSNNILIGTSSGTDVPSASTSNMINIGGVIKTTGIDVPSTSTTTIGGSLAVTTGASTNHAVCWKASGVLGYCSSTVGADGTCGTCN